MAGNCNTLSSPVRSILFGVDMGCQTCMEMIGGVQLRRRAADAAMIVRMTMDEGINWQRMGWTLACIL